MSIMFARKGLALSGFDYLGEPRPWYYKAYSVLVILYAMFIVSGAVNGMLIGPTVDLKLNALLVFVVAFIVSS